MNTQSAPGARGDASPGFEVVLESDVSAGSHARRAIDGLADYLPASTLKELRWVVTELVENSVDHGTGGAITVVVEITPSGMACGTVSDGGRGPVEIAPGRKVGDGGLGLRIVDALAARWGVRAPSSDIWFELAPAV